MSKYLIRGIFIHFIDFINIYRLIPLTKKSGFDIISKIVC